MQMFKNVRINSAFPMLHLLPGNSMCRCSDHPMSWEHVSTFYSPSPGAESLPGVGGGGGGARAVEKRSWNMRGKKCRSGSWKARNGTTGKWNCGEKKWRAGLLINFQHWLIDDSSLFSIIHRATVSCVGCSCSFRKHFKLTKYYYC